MTKENKDEIDNKRNENIFEIMDGIINQLNNTKRLFIIMILTVMIIPPLVFVITFELIASTDDTSYSSIEINHHKSEHRGGLFGNMPLFVITKNIPLIIGIVWLAIGIRQWIVLSKWNKKYQKYKELQKKIDNEIDNDYERGNNGYNNDKDKDKSSKQ